MMAGEMGRYSLCEQPTFGSTASLNTLLDGFSSDIIRCTNFIPMYLFNRYIGIMYVQRKWEDILCMEQQFLGQEDNKAFLVPSLKS